MTRMSMQNDLTLACRGILLAQPFSRFLLFLGFILMLSPVTIAWAKIVFSCWSFANLAFSAELVRNKSNCTFWLDSTFRLKWVIASCTLLVQVSLLLVASHNTSICLFGLSLISMLMLICSTRSLRMISIHVFGGLPCGHLHFVKASFIHLLTGVSGGTLLQRKMESV